MCSRSIPTPSRSRRQGPIFLSSWRTGSRFGSRRLLVFALMRSAGGRRRRPESNARSSSARRAGARLAGDPTQSERRAGRTRHRGDRRRAVVSLGRRGDEGGRRTLAAGDLVEEAVDDQEVCKHYLNGVDLVEDVAGSKRRLPEQAAPMLRAIAGRSSSATSVACVGCACADADPETSRKIGL